MKISISDLTRNTNIKKKNTIFAGQRCGVLEGEVDKKEMEESS